jgi:hypothetical protein
MAGVVVVGRWDGCGTNLQFTHDQQPCGSAIYQCSGSRNMQQRGTLCWVGLTSHDTSIVGECRMLMMVVIVYSVWVQRQH